MTIARSSNRPPPPDAPGIPADQVAATIDPAVKRAVAKLDEHQDAGRVETVSLESYQQLHRDFVDLTNRHVALERAVRTVGLESGDVRRIGHDEYRVAQRVLRRLVDAYAHPGVTEVSSEEWAAVRDYYGAAAIYDAAPDGRRGLMIRDLESGGLMIRCRTLLVAKAT